MSRHQPTGMMPLPGRPNRPNGGSGGPAAPGNQGPPPAASQAGRDHRPPVNPRGSQPPAGRGSQPPAGRGSQPPGRQGGPPPRGEQGKPRRRRGGIGRILGVLGTVLVLVLAGAWIYVDLSLQRTEALTDYEGRPAEASGATWLVVGSDSRAGLTEEDQQRLSTGSDGADGTDTVMLAHVPAGDTDPTLVSLPRDLRVDVPGHGTTRINAAYSLGGPALLTRTVEQTTGLRIDHYAEIGFAGFEDVVDAVGGVEMTIDQEMRDTRTDAVIEAGERTLDGAEALDFVRMRFSDATPRSDLDRIDNQRQLLGALASEVASPSTLLNPFQVVPLLRAGPEAITVDDSDRLHHLARLGWAMRGISEGEVVTTTVPIASAEAAALDQARAEALFEALRSDAPVPEDLIQQ